MATSMEADSEVLFKEKREGKGVKTETAVDNATLRFDFRASTPATSPPGRGAEHRGGDQFEEYATLGQWNEEEKASLLFLSLTAGARIYFVGLPEREKMAYTTRVEALWCRFGQETDTSIALQELAGLRRGKNQSAKELADSARRLASRAYQSNDYSSQEKAALHVFQTAVGEDLQLKCAERSCRTLEMAVETVEIQERYTKKAVWALKQEESIMALHLKAMGEKLEALMGEIKNDRPAGAVGGTPVIGPATKGRHGMSLVPPKRPFRERMPDQRYGRTLGKLTVAETDRGVGHGGKWTIPPWTDRGERGQLPGRHGIRGVHFGCPDVEEMGSCGGRANQVLGAAVFGRRTSARVPGQSTTYRDSSNLGHRVELHSGGNRRR